MYHKKNDYIYEHATTYLGGKDKNACPNGWALSLPPE
jgi:hypothetical protein